jgi:hypothetical protein
VADAAAARPPRDGRGAGECGAPTAQAASRARSRARARFTPGAMQALRYAIARLALDFASGPAGIAAWLRTTRQSHYSVSGGER